MVGLPEEEMVSAAKNEDPVDRPSLCNSSPNKPFTNGPYICTLWRDYKAVVSGGFKVLGEKGLPDKIKMESKVDLEMTGYIFFSKETLKF